MSKKHIIKIEGDVIVTVDAVEIEQIGIEQPGIAGDSINVKALAAAQASEGFKSILRTLQKHGSTLEPADYKYAGGGKVELMFIIVPMLQEAAA